jgi:hypothetical protein
VEGDAGGLVLLHPTKTADTDNHTMRADRAARVRHPNGFT